jgi:DNA-binding XRE family transcriptional regulator
LALGYGNRRLRSAKTNVCGIVKVEIDTFVLVDLGHAFGNVLKARRQEAGLTQEELAFQADMHSTAISLYERGLRQPTLYTVFKLALVLKTRPSSLVESVEGIEPEIS